ncbi:MAG: hypothetical protein JWM64_2017 [Frankiales bacterium]|nr:hypothetical protein [Frankiales bacterium]
MSARTASVPRLRDGARDLRAEATRLGEAARGTEQVRARLEKAWWGPHAGRWRNRSRALHDAERRAEAALRRTAGAVDRYAETVERAQHALAQIDRDADAARAAASHALAGWSAQPVAARGPRPSGVGLGPFQAREQQVEAQAERDAQAFAAEVAAALHELDALVAAEVPASTLTVSPVWEGVVRAPVLLPLPLATGGTAEVVPAAGPLVLPVRQPLPRGPEVTVAVDVPAEPVAGPTALDALAGLVSPLVQAAAGSPAPADPVVPRADGVEAAVADLTAAVYLLTQLTWAAVGVRPRPGSAGGRPWGGTRPRPPLVPRPRDLPAPLDTASTTSTGARR